MREYILTRRGINAVGGLEIIYKTNITLESLEGLKIADIENSVRRDLHEPLGLMNTTKIIVVSDTKDNTMSVVLRAENNIVCNIFRNSVTIDDKK